MSTPVVQAVAMVEVTKEMRRRSLQPWDSSARDRFSWVYGNLVANAIEDISRIHGEYQ